MSRCQIPTCIFCEEQESISSKGHLLMSGNQMTHKTMCQHPFNATELIQIVCDKKYFSHGH